MLKYESISNETVTIIVIGFENNEFYELSFEELKYYIYFRMMICLT